MDEVRGDFDGGDVVVVGGREELGKSGGGGAGCGPRVRRMAEGSREEGGGGCGLLW
ncbi:uncharacterized protein M6B38_103020 [Iris pallida]|uniref:Uncharacterized protein n=1 Tax=Iris pallida TaxID=29817 RepID=A0AAX6G7E7_IRIPA|nr:uncharacterized protein M6B38_103020 [Iris pallida]